MLENLNIDFMGKRKYMMAFSGTLMVVAIISFFVKGIELGIDFTGGTLVEVGYQQPVDLTVLRNSLAESGFEDATVQHVGTAKNVLIRLKPRDSVKSSELSNQVLAAANKNAASPAELRRIEFVGAVVGDDLAQDGGLALLYATFGILVYVAWRFEHKFAVGAVAASLHDLVITMGLISVTGMEFDLTVLAAILALFGYSLNDTIVVYDRIRENFRKLRKDHAVNIINLAVNETLSRTIMTSVTVMLVLTAQVFLGGSIIHNFAVALLFGVFFGTYSSICIASPIVLAMGISKEDLTLPEKEGAHIDNMP